MENADSEREEPVHAQNEETVAALHSLQLSAREYLRPEYGPPSEPHLYWRLLFGSLSPRPSVCNMLLDIDMPRDRKLVARRRHIRF